MSPTLELVADNAAAAGAARESLESLSDKIRRLQAEAKGLARDHVKALEQALMQVERMSAEIADGGDAYPPGVRDIARRLREDCELRVQTLEAIVSRN